MANNDFIQAQEIIDKINTAFNEQIRIVDNLTDSIRDLSSRYRTMPSNIANGQQNLTDNINSEIQARRNLIEVERRLERQRRNSNVQTAQEIVNQRQLRQNADREAIANSQLAGEYQRLNARRGQAARILQDLVVRGRQATQTQREFNRELRNAQREYDRLNGRVVSANRAIGRFNDQVGNYPQRAILGLRDLIGAFGVVGGVSAFAAITKSIFETTKEIQGLDLALRQVINDSDELAQTQQFLTRIAEAYGIEINGLTRSYTQFYVSAKDKISGQEIQGIFESISKAAGAMGLTVEQQEGAFTALTQMLSKGTVQAEELRGQLSERLPGAFRILAESMGVTEIQLNQLLKDGQVLAADVLPEFAKQLEKAYNIETLDRVETLSAETSRLSNAWTDLVRALTEGDSIVSKAMAGIVSYANQTLQNITRVINHFNEFTVDELISSAYTTELERFQAQAYISADALKEMASVELGTLTNQLTKLEDARKKIAGDNEGGIMNILTGGASGQRATQKGLAENSDAQARLIGRINALNDIISGNVDLRKEQNKATATGTELTDAQRKALEKAREEEERRLYMLKKIRIENDKDYLETLLKDETKYAQEREMIAQEITTREIDLAELAKDEGLRLAKGNKTQQLIVWEEYYKDYASIVERDEDRINKLKEQAFKDYQDYTQTFSGEGLNVLGQGEGIAGEWFDRQKEKARQFQERIDSLRESTRQFFEEITSGFLSDAGFGSLTQFFDSTFDPITGKFQTTFGKLYEGADTLREKFAVTFQAVSSVAQDAFNFMSQLSNKAFEVEYENLQIRYEVAQRFAGENEAAQEELRRQYEERRKDIRRRELEAQKEQAIFNATINVAQGVTAAISQGPSGIPLAVIIGAIGAAQIAFIASQQIPSYAEGTMNHPGGMMLVNDAKGANFKEVIQHPDGRIITPNKRNTLMNAPKGTKVYKSRSEFERQREGFDGALNGILSDAGIGGLGSTINRDRFSGVVVNSGNNGLTKEDVYHAFKEAIAGMPVIRQHWDKDGMVEWHETQTTRTLTKGNQVSFKGIST